MTEGGASLTAAGGGRGVGLRGFDDAGGEELGQQVVHVHLTEVVLRRDDLRIYGNTNNPSPFLTLNSMALKPTDTNATHTYSAVRKARRSEVGRAGPWLPSRSPENRYKHSNHSPGTRPAQRGLCTNQTISCTSHSS